MFIVVTSLSGGVRDDVEEECFFFWLWFFCFCFGGCERYLVQRLPPEPLVSVTLGLAGRFYSVRPSW